MQRGWATEEAAGELSTMLQTMWSRSAKPRYDVWKMVSWRRDNERSCISRCGGNLGNLCMQRSVLAQNRFNTIMIPQALLCSTATLSNSFFSFWCRAAILS